MSEFKYVCIPVRSEQEGIETAEDVIGAMMWNNDGHKRPQAWPYDNDNPIIVMDSPLLLEKQLAEARAEIERKDKLIEQMRAALTKLIGTLEVMSVMPETLGKCPVLAIDAPELEQARAALAAERGMKSE